jgi:protease-4
MNKNVLFAVFGGVLIAVILFAASGLFLMGSLFSMSEMDSTTHKPIGLIKLEGVIQDPLPVLVQVEKLRSNPDIKGIVFRVNSPGGTVGSAQEILSMIASLHADSIKTVVSFGDVAASGGYYSVLGADRIFANPGTLTASIGVIMQYPEGGELLDKIGIDMITLKSGELKDAGSPFRKPTAADLNQLNAMIMNTREQFIEAVQKHRNLSPQNLELISDGRVITGAVAKDLGLIDTLGSYRDALLWLVAECGLEYTGLDMIREVKPPKSLMQTLFEEPLARAFQSVGANSGLQYRMP